jgi:hypothetical protein
VQKREVCHEFGNAVRKKEEDGTRKEMGVGGINRRGKMKGDGKDRENGVVVRKEEMVALLAHPYANGEILNGSDRW